jgi:LPS-assembly protein
LAAALLLAAVLAGPVPAHAQSAVAQGTSTNGSGFIDPSAGRNKADSSFGQTSITGPLKRPEPNKPLLLTADTLDYETRRNLVIARGNVEIYFNDYALTADEVIYDQTAKTLTAIGNVRIQDPNGNVISAERYQLADDFSEGFAESLSITTKDQTRIAARRAIRRDGNVTEFEEGRFSPCKNDPGKPPLWCISAQRVIHDQDAATISYQDAWFELYGVPVLWMPYFQHPDPSVKRRSGFLMPEHGSSTTLGYTVEVPYFFALAPNYDFLFHPMYTSKQGILWQGEWRHRLAFENIRGIYNVKLAGIDQNDADEKIIRKELQNQWRGSVETHGRFSLSSWWQFGWDVVLESDDTFRRFYKLDSVLQTDRVNSAFLIGQSDRSFFSTYLYHFGGLLLNDTSQAESRVAPVIDYNYVFADPILGGELSFNANALSFWQNLTFTDSIGKVHNVDSSVQRFVFDINWRRRLIDPIGQTFTPFANLRGDAYAVKDTVDPVTRNLISDDTVTRGLATAGLLYAYPFAAATSSAAHTIEPLAQIIARQASVEQRRVPDLDSRSVIADDTNLFEVDKIDGADRIETGTRVNYGMQYTYQAFSGGSARVLAGQSYHLSGDNIYTNPGYDPDGRPLYTPNSGLETARSDYVLGLYMSPSPIFRAVAQARFDENDLALKRSDVFANLNYGPIIAQTAYAFAAASPTLVPSSTDPSSRIKDQQEIISLLGLRVTDNWSVLGQVRYDIDAKERLQDVFQLRYADDCFVLSATYTETFITNIDRDLHPDRTVMVRFELKNLGDFRYKTSVVDQLFADNQSPKP